MSLPTWDVPAHFRAPRDACRAKFIMTTHDAAKGSPGGTIHHDKRDAGRSDRELRRIRQDKVWTSPVTAARKNRRGRLRGRHCDLYITSLSG